MSDQEKQVVVQPTPTHKTSAHIPTLASNDASAVDHTKKHHHHHENCCHSDVSDNEQDTEPGQADPINEYDPDLEYIDHTNDRLTTMGAFKQCKKLQSIVLRCNKFTNDIFSQLNECEQLEHIDLYENRLTPIPRDTNPLSNLKNLEELDLSFNELRFTRGLAGLDNLKSLYLIQNKIVTIEEDINTISSKLKILELGSNRIRIIENLNNFPLLEQLFLGRNKITTILPTSFIALPKLRLLSLQSNRLTTLTNLEPIALTLEELYVSHNGLTSIHGVKCLQNIVTLDLSNNFITDIDVNELKDLQYLEELWLNNNNITSLDWLYSLTHLKNLRTLYLEHNPCIGDTSVANPTERAAYISKISRILPQLTQIDAEYL